MASDNLWTVRLATIFPLVYSVQRIAGYVAETVATIAHTAASSDNSE